LLFVYWIIIMFTVHISIFCVTKLKFIGPGHRYLENSSIAVALISAKLLFTLDYNIVKVLFTSCVILSMCAYYHMCKIETKTANMFILSDNQMKIFKYIKKSYKENVMCIPHTLSYVTAYWTNKKVLDVSSALAWKSGYIEDDFLGKSPDMVELGPILKRYNINFIIVNTKLYKVNNLDLHERYKAVEQEGEYILIEDE
ncbi:MAG: hypothetical protein K8S56_03585, partial [Candidatus Cloacimonetes bacterium]|nr:hypothetical protein [Candidatus Cloacimonadota bacterium]